MTENENPLRRFVHWIAPNAIWDVIKWVGGSSMMTSVGHLWWLEFHRSPVDWYWLAGLFGIGILLVLIASFLQPKQPVHRPISIAQPTPRLKIISAHYGIPSIHEENVLEAVQLLPRDALVIQIENNTLKCDPIQNVPGKHLRVSYSYGTNKEHEISLPEHSRMVLPEARRFGEPKKEDQPLSAVLAEQVAGLQKELQQVKAESMSLAVGGVLVAGPAAHAEERARQEALKRPIGNMLKPLQMEAIELANDLRNFVDGLGPIPVVDKSKFGRDIEAHLKEVHRTVDPWCETARAKYELDFQGRVEQLRKRFTVEGIDSDSLNEEVRGREVKRIIRSMASELWSLASKVGVREEGADEKDIGIPGRY